MMTIRILQAARGAALLLLAPLAWAGGAAEQLQPVAERPWSRLDGAPLRPGLESLRGDQPQWGPDLGAFELLEGALLPGLNQARHGQWWKAAVFAGVEVGTLLLARSFERRGDELDREFIDYAEQHWSYERYINYRQAPGEFALEEGWLNRQILSEELDAAASQEEIDALFFGEAAADDLFDPAGGRGSHVLPGGYTDGYSMGERDAWHHFSLFRTQQFYEMIGKYAQFQRGWDDFGQDRGFEFGAQTPWSVTYFSSGSAHYMSLRDESNRKLIAADRVLGLLLVNHAASFFDVLLRHGRADGALRASATALPASEGSVAALRLSWSLPR
jgi:hypothetical protein